VTWGPALILDKLAAMQVLELSLSLYMVVQMFNKLLLLACKIWMNMLTFFPCANGHLWPLCLFLVRFMSS